MRRITGDLPPNAGCFIELQKHHLPSRRTAAAGELNAKLPRPESHVQGPMSKVQSLKSSGLRPWTLNFGLWTYEPLHIGPGRLAAISRRAEEQTERSTAFGGKLQAAKVAHIEPIARCPNRSHARAAQRLIERPEGIGVARRPQHEHLRQIDAPGGGSGGIKMGG